MTDHIDVEELSVARTIPLRGKQVRVLPIDGFGYRLLAQQQKGDEAGALNIMYRVAAKCLSLDMTEDEVVGTDTIHGLSAEEIGYVVGAAQAQARTVEALASPNSEPAGVTAPTSS